MAITKVQVNDGTYETIVQLYKEVAKCSGYKVTEQTKFDCTKIMCSTHIQDNIFEYYKSVGMAEDEIGMAWCIFGPKADDGLGAMEVAFAEGAIYESD